MSPITNGSAAESTASNLPSWFGSVTLNKALREHVGEFEQIISIHPKTDTNSNENCSALMCHIDVEVLLKDGTSKTSSFVLKTQHPNEVMANIITMLQLLPKEEDMYHRIIPKFEKLYGDVGKSIKFAPTAYKFDRDFGLDYVLLEDLKKRNFKNANASTGFDMEHMKLVLTKLAEFHAASASYVEHFGMYGDEFTIGMFTESNRELIKEFNSSDVFLSQLKKWKNGQQYYNKLVDSDSYLVDRLYDLQKMNPREFNVLNHGDCWLNNIMFQYDAFGKIKNTVFVDFQVGKYGSPANDLYYLILSSAAMDIKLTQFDYFVRFYYDQLVENLKLLQYQRPLPKLKNLHTALLKNGFAAYLVVSKVLPVVLMEKSNAQDETQLKTAMYANHKYAKVMSEILPWMDNRGLLEWK